MSIKLVQTLNNIIVRLDKKIDDINYQFILKNKNTKEEFTYNVVDLNILSFNCLFIVDIGLIPNGEYIYTIKNNDDEIVRTGIAYYPTTTDSLPEYNQNNTYISYGN